MKFLSSTLFAVVFVFSSMSFAFDHNHNCQVTAKGHVFYKSKGNLTKRDVTLVGPKKKGAPVTLKYGKYEAKSAKYKMHKRHGAKRFTVVFKNLPKAPKGTFAVFTGALLRDSKLAVYYGDMYFGKKKGCCGAEDILNSWGEEDEDHHHHKHHVHYVGGFGFKAKHACSHK